jgi:hypothetical protein
MTVCAVVDSSNTIINLIVAEPTDLAPQDCILVITPDSNGNQPGSGWTWDGTTFINPNPVDTSDYSYGN